MKIYGYTVVVTEGFEDGRKSSSYVFITKEDRDKYAYTEYRERLELDLEYDDVIGAPYGDKDCWEIPDKKEFLDDFYIGYPYIQTRNSRFQIESWEAIL